jgi:kynurenine formamidase
MHYPAFSIEAAKLLIERKVVGLGIDTYGIDYGPSKTYDVHHLVLSANLYAIENLSDLSDVPESGAFIVAAPIKLDGGSGGPCRVFAILPH